jgi:predicted nucleic acid-binding protein
MRLVDTSVWIDYLRGSDTRARHELRRMLAHPADVAITEPVVMELLAGVTDDKALSALEALTTGLPMISVDPRLDYRDAATIYRAVRRRGQTVRRLNDCLIAAIALRAGATLVHKDADFDVIARCVRLEAMSLL